MKKSLSLCLVFVQVVFFNELIFVCGCNDDICREETLLYLYSFVSVKIVVFAHNCVFVVL